jgi:REP element-mobilizing transposase RayT
MVRGIERCNIFLDDADREDFVGRLEKLLVETETDCFAWALMSNHFHLLLCPRTKPLASFMRRLLTGYAVSFNLRHDRSGHLFQNRYKSIVCEEDPYLLELVRYIHLNPLRAGLVPDLAALDNFPWSGHAVLLGNSYFQPQKTDDILSLFGTNQTAARAGYRDFVAAVVSLGKRKELSGGGLQRVRAMMGDGISAYDERILGSGDFVNTLQDMPQSKDMISPADLIRKVAELLEITPDDIRNNTRRKSVADAKAVVCYIGTARYRLSGESLAKALGISRSGVCRGAKRGEEITRTDSRYGELRES